ncbi:MAG TPA: hypothetical protein PLC15_14650 [Candidatus Obscuribacter sp.]|nr:hypothetical protein [Candidatus Obscuribacter sp.]
MTYHTPILLLIAIISLPLFLAYRRSFRIGNQAHLDLMLTRDGVARTVPAADSYRIWQQQEKLRFRLGIAFMVLLLTWCAMQLLAPESWSVLDIICSAVFCLTSICLQCSAEDYKQEDLANSLGFGERSRLRYQLPTTAA